MTREGPSSELPTEHVDLDELVAHARRLISTGSRRLLGITGAPGSGKSTLAHALVSALGSSAVDVGLDGFHLADDELRRLGRYERKGAADTFDSAGYVHLLRRLRSQRDNTVYVPVFDRAVEASFAGARPVPPDVPLIVTEGNYLLVDDPMWGEVRTLLDECWYVDPGEDERLRRLVARHQAYGRSRTEAEARSHGSDARNAELIAGSRRRADRVLRMPRTDEGNRATAD